MTGHREGPQKGLAKLYRTAKKRVADELTKVIRERGSSGLEISSVVDIGCGLCPYGGPLVKLLQEKPDGRPLIEFWDRDVEIPCVSIGEGEKEFKYEIKHLDARFLIDEDIAHKAGLQKTNYSSKYDIVVFVATLHELFLEYKKPDFLEEIFKALKDITRPGGHILVSDFFLPSYLRPDETEIIELVQGHLLDHGDPATAFHDPSLVIGAARKEGLALIREYRIAPLEQLSHDKLLTRFKSFQKKNGFKVENGKVIAPEAIKGRDWSYVAAIFKMRKCFIALFQRSESDIREYPTPECAKKYFGAVIDPTGKILKSISHGQQQIDDAVNTLSKNQDMAPDRIPLQSKERGDLIDLYRGELDGSQKGFFLFVAKECQQVQQTWHLYRRRRPFGYVAYWLGYNSILLPHEPGKEFARFMPTFGKESVSITFTLNDDQPFQRRELELSQIAFNKLLFPEGPLGIEVHQDKDKPRLLGPSLHDWLSRIADRGDNLINSISVYCSTKYNENAYDPKRIRFEADKLTEESIIFEGKNKCGHLVFDLSERPSPSEPSPLPFEFGRLVNLFCSKKAEGIAYCAEPDNLSENEKVLWKRWLEGIASVFFDLVFVFRDVSPSLPLDKYKEQTYKSIDAFEKRWLNSPEQVKFVAFDCTILSANKCILPTDYGGEEGFIGTAIKQVREFLKQVFTDDGQGTKKVTFPRAMTTISLAGSRSPRISPGTLMLFSDELGDWRLFDLLTLATRRSFQLLRDVEAVTDAKIMTKTEARAEELRKRQVAIAGFSHQVTHVFGESLKSGFSLLRFIDCSTDAGERDDITLQQLWAFAADKWESKHPEGVELAARIAQIKYARLVPDIVRDVLDPPVDKNIFNKQVMFEPYILVNEVWEQMVKPLMLIKSARKSNYTCFGKKIKLNITGHFPKDILIPARNHLVQAIVFEMLWNALRHGDWKEETADPVLAGKKLGGKNNPDIYILEVTNPCKVNATCVSDTGLSYMRWFASALHSMIGARDIDLQVEKSLEKIYSVRLTLPWEEGQTTYG